MYLNNKKLFLAGATGLVGSAILKYIIANCPGTRIKAVYHERQPFIEHDNIDYVHVNLFDLDECRAAVAGCDCAVMVAAVTENAYTFTHGRGLSNDNIAMNMKMLEAFLLEGVERVIYIGSSTIYQEREGFIKEDDLDYNKDPYAAYFNLGWSIRFVEKLCGYWHKTYGKDMIVVRASNVFGPYAKFHPKTSNFIPALVRKGVDKMDPFVVWGGPDVTRDVIYSEDFAEAIITILNSDIKFDVFNVGSGVAIKVSEVVASVLKHCNYQPRIQYDSTQPTTIAYRALDCAKLKQALGWSPKHTIDDGIKETIDWWGQNKGWWTR
ncbi:MAG: NAD-dependent epimerase/dehydratase family protein [Candidatus Margulisiibacteriota bacterium]